MFEVIEDPHSGIATRHPFGSILFAALCALLCGINTCEDFVRFAKARQEWLREWIALPGGIPCANTFLRGSRKADESTVQILSARACHGGLTLSQRAVDQKSNEITGVPELPRHLNPGGAIVSIHAALDPSSLEAIIGQRRMQVPRRSIRLPRHPGHSFDRIPPGRQPHPSR